MSQSFSGTLIEGQWNQYSDTMPKILEGDDGTYFGITSTCYGDHVQARFFSIPGGGATHPGYAISGRWGTGTGTETAFSSYSADGSGNLYFPADGSADASTIEGSFLVRNLRTDKAANVEFQMFLHPNSVSVSGSMVSSCSFDAMVTPAS